MRSGTDASTRRPRTRARTASRSSRPSGMRALHQALPLVVATVTRSPSRAKRSTNCLTVAWARRRPPRPRDGDVVDDDREGPAGVPRGPARCWPRAEAAASGSVSGAPDHEGLEAHDLPRPSVLLHDEVVPRQPARRLAVLVEHDGVHRDHLHRGRERGRGLRRLGTGRGLAGRRCGWWRDGRQCRWWRGRLAGQPRRLVLDRDGELPEVRVASRGLARRVEDRGPGQVLVLLPHLRGNPHGEPRLGPVLGGHVRPCPRRLELERGLAAQDGAARGVDPEAAPRGQVARSSFLTSVGRAVSSNSTSSPSTVLNRRVPPPFHAKRCWLRGWRNARASVGKLMFRTAGPMLYRALSCRITCARCAPLAWGGRAEDRLQPALAVAHLLAVHLEDVAEGAPRDLASEADEDDVGPRRPPAGRGGAEERGPRGRGSPQRLRPLRVDLLGRDVVEGPLVVEHVAGGPLEDRHEVGGHRRWSTRDRRLRGADLEGRPLPRREERAGAHEHGHCDLRGGQPHGDHLPSRTGPRRRP